MWPEKQLNSANIKFSKGQLISKGLVGILNSSKKWTKKFNLQYYDTSGWLVFIRFLEELKTPKSPFEINWPLKMYFDEYILIKDVIVKAGC